MNACTESEFNCHDGYCIDIFQRCDGKTDCPDKSGTISTHYFSHLMFCHVYTFADEMDCVTFTKETGYLKEVPPPPVQLTGRHSFDGGKTDIGVHVNISAILARSTKCHLLIACLNQLKLNAGYF